MSDADLYDLEAGLPGSAEPAGRCARSYRAARRCCSRWHEPAPLRLALYLAGFALVQSGLWSGLLWAESAEPVWTFGLPGWLCFLIWFIAQRRVLRVHKPGDEPDEALRFERHHRRLRLRENGATAKWFGRVSNQGFRTALTAEPMDSGCHFAEFTLLGNGAFNVGVAPADQDPDANRYESFLKLREI